MKARLLCAALTASAILLVTSASAAIVTAEYTGTVVGTDDLRLFGGGDLSGASFTADFLYDTTIAGLTTSIFSPTFNKIEGGIADATPSPLLQGSLTINGITQTMRGSYVGLAAAENGRRSGFQNHVTHLIQQDTTNGFCLSFNGSTESGDIPATIDVPLTFIIGPSDTGSGSALISMANGVERLSLSPTKLVYTVQSAWPRAHRRANDGDRLSIMR
jgi:hypothetical protein